MSLGKLFAVVVPLFVVVDLLWLGVIMKDFYARELGDLARRDGASLAPRWIPALLVYLLIPAGLVFFARPTIGSGGWAQSVGRAALYGFILYGVYDLTNLAVLEKWTTRMTIADMAWGATLCGLFGAVMHYLVRA